MAYFIDSHCHLLTIADIPLYKPIEQLVEDCDGLKTYLALPLVPFIRPFYNPKKAVEHYPWIHFFESEPEQVVPRTPAWHIFCFSNFGKSDMPFRWEFLRNHVG